MAKFRKNSEKRNKLADVYREIPEIEKERNFFGISQEDYEDFMREVNENNKKKRKRR